MSGAVSVPMSVFSYGGIIQEVGVVLDFFYLHFDIVFLLASLISAVLYYVKDFTPSVVH